MEKMVSGYRESKAYLSFLKSWRSAGFPKQFRWNPKEGQILDASAKRAKLLDRLHPQRTADRKARGELEYRRKVNSLLYD